MENVQPLHVQLEQAVARLTQENERLREQVRHQVRTEQTLLATQKLADEQMHIYQRLHEIGQSLNKTLDLNEIFQLAVKFVLYELNFERCLLLLRQADSSYAVVASEGYYDEAQARSVNALTLAIAAGPALQPLLNGAGPVVCDASSDRPELVELRRHIGIDEYVIYPLATGVEAAPIGLLITGSTTAMAGYHTPVDLRASQMLGLASLVNQITTSITVTSLYREVEQERANLEGRVEERTAELRALQETLIRDLSTPLIALADNVLLLPLVGSVDSRRALQMMETLLEGVALHHATTVIVDITGVTVVDSQVASSFVRAAQAVRMLGAQILLTGIGPEMAETLVNSGADLSGIASRGSLQQAIQEVLGVRRRPGRSAISELL